MMQIGIAFEVREAVSGLKSYGEPAQVTSAQLTYSIPTAEIPGNAPDAPRGHET